MDTYSIYNNILTLLDNNNRKAWIPIENICSALNVSRGHVKSAIDMLSIDNKTVVYITTGNNNKQIVTGAKIYKDASTDEIYITDKYYSGNIKNVLIDKIFDMLKLRPCKAVELANGLDVKLHLVHSVLSYTKFKGLIHLKDNRYHLSYHPHSSEDANNCEDNEMVSLLDKLFAGVRDTIKEELKDFKVNNDNEKMVNGLRETIGKLGREVQIERDINKDLKSTNSTQFNELAEIKEDFHDLRLDNDRWMIKVNALNKEIRDKDNEITRLQNEHKKSIEFLKSQIAIVNNRVAEREAELQACTNEIKIANKSNKDKDVLIKSLNNEINNFKSLMSNKIEINKINERKEAFLVAA